MNEAKTEDIVLKRIERMYIPILNELRERGGEAKAGEISKKVADLVETCSTKRQEVHKSGFNKIENEVFFARNDLCNLGLISREERGIWKLTAEGKKVKNINEIFTIKEELSKLKKKDIHISVPILEVGTKEIKSLIDCVYELSPTGFEKLCKHLLFKTGISDIKLTPGTNDKGIDGEGYLYTHPLVSTLVLFQCKRYKTNVGSPDIRNFRGTMAGRTKRGIFFTTSSFTPEAIKEATREGVPKIELVDGFGLTDLMEKYEIGVKKSYVYIPDIQKLREFEL